MYAKAFFKNMQFDAVTIAPYMGEDSVVPFFPMKINGQSYLHLHPIRELMIFSITMRMGSGFLKSLDCFQRNGVRSINLMFVIGATRAEMFRDIRKIVPEHFLLVPGVGAQGGSLQEVAKYE